MIRRREGGARVLSHRVARTSAAVLTASVATLGLGVSGASFGLHEREGQREGGLHARADDPAGAVDAGGRAVGRRAAHPEPCCHYFFRKNSIFTPAISMRS